MEIISDGGITSCNIIDTLDALLLTKNLYYLDGVKIDILMSKDKELVLFPSNELKDFTLSNKKVSDCNYSYLRKVKYPSHIFKYFIPKLEEFLIKYQSNKKIVLALYPSDDMESYLNKLKEIIVKYPYTYYFFTENAVILNNLKEKDFSKIGVILNNSNVIQDYDELEDITSFENKIFITKNPEKIYQDFHSTKY